MTRSRLLAALTFVVIVVAACGGTASGSPAAASADPTKDKLAQVLARGTLALSTDPDYAPAVVPGRWRRPRGDHDKCAPNQLTAPEMSGYDAEVGKLVAAELGVEPCFVVAPVREIIAGGWGDRWMSPGGRARSTADRMKKLYMTQPYYSTPANFFVKKDSTVPDPGRPVGQEDRRVRRLHPRAVPAQARCRCPARP